MVFSQKVYGSFRRKRLIGINELSEYLQVSKNTIYPWVWQKRIPYTKIGHLLRFDLSVIEQWIKENSVAAFEIVDAGSAIR